MVKSGVSPKTAQSLARHSKIDLTMNVYTALTVLDQASALASLLPVPSLNGPKTTAAALKATGTDGNPMVPSGAEKWCRTPRIEPVADRAGLHRRPPDARMIVTRIKNAKSSGKTGASRNRPHRSASDCRAERQGNGPSLSINLFQARQLSPTRFRASIWSTSFNFIQRPLESCSTIEIPTFLSQRFHKFRENSNRQPGVFLSAEYRVCVNSRSADGPETSPESPASPAELSVSEREGR